MTSSAGALQKKIKTAGDLQSVVRTMKALAASSIGEYENSVRALVDYTRAVELGLGACLRQSEPRPLTTTWEGRTRTARVGAVVFGSDQGLVGRFNEVIADYAIGTLAALRRETRIWAVGERVRPRLSDAGLQLMRPLTVPTSVRAITPLVGQILVESETLHGQRGLQELYLFYNRPTSEAACAPHVQRLLPLDEQWRRKLVELPWPPGSLPEVLGGESQTLRALVREYLFIWLFRACAESLASENASRLAAMARAERNIDELLEGLHRAFHQARQNSIDEELFDVVSGFEALT